MLTLDKILAENDKTSESFRLLFARKELFADVHHIMQPNVVDRVPVKYKKGRSVKGGGDPVTLRVAELCFAKCHTPRLASCLAPCLASDPNQTLTLALTLALTLMLILTLTVPALAAAEPADANAAEALAAALAATEPATALADLIVS